MSLQFVSMQMKTFIFVHDYTLMSLLLKTRIQFVVLEHIRVWIRFSFMLKESLPADFINVFFWQEQLLCFSALLCLLLKFWCKLHFVQITLQVRIWAHLEPSFTCHVNSILLVAHSFFPSLGSVTCTVDTLIFQSSRWNQMELMRPLGPNGPHVYTLVHQLSSVQPQVSRAMVRCPQNPLRRVWTW